jgi:hypothetical protein
MMTLRAASHGPHEPTDRGNEWVEVTMTAAAIPRDDCISGLVDAVISPLGYSGAQ